MKWTQIFSESNTYLCELPANLLQHNYITRYFSYFNNSWLYVLVKITFSQYFNEIQFHTLESLDHNRRRMLHHCITYLCRKKNWQPGRNYLILVMKLLLWRTVIRQPPSNELLHFLSRRNLKSSFITSFSIWGSWLSRYIWQTSIRRIQFNCLIYLFFSFEISNKLLYLRYNNWYLEDDGQVNLPSIRTWLQRRDTANVIHIWYTWEQAK